MFLTLDVSAHVTLHTLKHQRKANYYKIEHTFKKNMSLLQTLKLNFRCILFAYVTYK